MASCSTGWIGSMGVTYVPAIVSNPRVSGGDKVALDFLVDTGAIYSVLPASVLDGLRVPRLKRQRFTLADGTQQDWDVGEAFFELGDDVGTSFSVRKEPCRSSGRSPSRVSD